MNTSALNELIAVIQEELALGEKLLVNLDGQRKAILSWSITDLMHQIEAREPLLRSLAELEASRHQTMARFSHLPDEKPSLKEIIGRFPESEREIVSLRHLQSRLQDVYFRLQAEEKALLALMGNLLEHIREALHPLGLPSVSLYGENGTTVPQHPASGLIQGKA